MIIVVPFCHFVVIFTKTCNHSRNAEDTVVQIIRVTAVGPGVELMMKDKDQWDYMTIMALQGFLVISLCACVRTENRLQGNRFDRRAIQYSRHAVVAISWWQRCVFHCKIKGMAARRRYDHGFSGVVAPPSEQPWNESPGWSGLAAICDASFDSINQLINQSINQETPK